MNSSMNQFFRLILAVSDEVASQIQDNKFKDYDCRKSGEAMLIFDKNEHIATLTKKGKE